MSEYSGPQIEFYLVKFISSLIVGDGGLTVPLDTAYKWLNLA